MRLGRLTCALAVWVAAADGTRADEPLVTPIRVGRKDAPIVLSMWAQPDYSHLAARQSIAEAFTAIFEDWARARPDVRVDISVMPALEMHKAKLLLAANSGRLPDVASIDSFWMPLFKQGEELQPLNPNWPAEERADFLPFAIDTLSDRAGNVYGLWHGTDCRLLFYRKDLVPQPPRTWDELLRIASRIAKEKGIAGYLFNAGRWEAAVFDHLPMFWGQGGELVDVDGRPIFGKPPHRERMVKLLSFLHQAVETGASPRSVLASNDYKQLSSAAIAGDVAMFLGGNWQLAYELEQGLKKEDLAKWDIAPIPQAEPGAAPTGTGGWVWVVFAKDAAKRRAATELIRFIESPEHVARIARGTGHLPVRRSVYQMPFYRDDPWLARFGAMLKHARARPAVPIYPYLSEQLQIAIGAAIAGSATPEQALDRAFEATVATDVRQREPRRPPAFDVFWPLPIAFTAALTLAFLLSLRRRADLLAWLLPALALVALVLLYPIVDLFRIAFSDMRTGGGAARYGLVSFAELLEDSEFHGMLAVTLVFVVSCVALQLGLGLLLAVALDSARRAARRGTLAVRIAVVSAWVVPGVLVGVLWKILLVENRSGIANYALSLFGWGPLPWLSSPALAMVSVIVANTWRGSAFSMILQYAALQRIPRELHEAADLEGVTPWGRFRVVVWPQIRAAVALNLALITISTLNTFDLFLPLTGGGPARATEVVSLFMYRSAFMSLEAGRAAAVAVVMLGLNVVLALLALRLIREQEAAR